MKKACSIFFKMTVISLAVAVICVGCVSSKKTNPTPVPVVESCPLPSGYIVEQAFQTARSTLSNPACRYKFDAVLASLLHVCEGAPEMKNKELFHAFFEWAKDEGIISLVQAKKHYTRYFSNRFISLPDNYQICSHCSRLKPMMKNCRDELKRKEQGLLKVCGDKATYAKASGDLDKVALILEATCRSCAAE